MPYHAWPELFHELFHGFFHELSYAMEIDLEYYVFIK